MELYRAHWSRAGVLLACLVCSASSSAPQSSPSGPILQDWSRNSYGPDGPWHALNVSIGRPPQFVDLLPGHLRSSFPLANQACVPQESCPSRKGGYYEIAKSQSVHHPDPVVAAAVEQKAFQPGYGFSRSVSTNGTVVAVSDVLSIYSDSKKFDIPLAGFEPISNAFSTTTDTGNSYPVTLGFIDIGASFGGLHSYNESGKVYPKYDALQYLYRSQRIQSPSFALHVGSPSLSIAPSYVLGGYDRSRVLGRVISQALSQTLHFALTLTDIGLKTEFGPSPFENGGQSGLLTDFVGPVTSLPISIGLTLPYLFLPGLTCENLAKYLPIYLSNQYGVYIWRRSDPIYEKIMSSPSYLYMSFQPAKLANALDIPVKIKIPFQLLNLILEDPIATKPIPYFPCAPVSELPGLSLGRAFLQAATMGVNWNVSHNTHDTPGYWFLAQAPGPDITAPSLASIQTSDISIYGHAESWERTWEKYWNQSLGIPPGNPTKSPTTGPTKSPTTGPTKSSTKSPTTSPATGPTTGPTTSPTTRPTNPVTTGVSSPGSHTPLKPSGGLSMGAAAGIGVAAAFVVIAVVVLIGFCVVRQRRRRKAQDGQSSSSATTHPKNVYSPDFSRVEVQETSQNISQDVSGDAPQQMLQNTNQSNTSQSAPQNVHELPVPDSFTYMNPSRFGSTQYASSHQVSTQSVSTQYATAAPYDTDGIVSPISPAPWSSTTLGEPMNLGQQPPPSYPEMEADRGAELEAPRQVEKSGFLVA